MIKYDTQNQESHISETIESDLKKYVKLENYVKLSNTILDLKSYEKK